MVRIAARRTESGRVELGLQRRAAGRWERLVQPQAALLPADPSVDRWYFSSALELPAVRPNVAGELRRGATIDTVGTELRLTVDGNALMSRCGLLGLVSITQTILVDTLDDGCADPVALATICSAGTASGDCDRQQNLVYQWEDRQPGIVTASAIEVSRSEAQAIVGAIYDDYIRDRRAPRVVFASDQRHGHYSGSEDRIVLGTGVRNLGSAIHALAHALVDRAGVRDADHGGAFTAMLLQIWSTHLPIVDPGIARTDADSAGLRLADYSPLPLRSDGGVAVMRATLCAYSARSDELCRAFDGETGSVTAGSLAGRYVGWGHYGDGFWWHASEASDGDVWTNVVKDASVVGAAGRIVLLEVSCDDGELGVGFWWDVDSELNPTVRFKVGAGEFSQQTWPRGTGSWGYDEFEWIGPADPLAFAAYLAWAAQAGDDLTIQARARNNSARVFTAVFDLDGVFETPVQPNLAGCGH